MPTAFEWDVSKAVSNYTKHGISFELAVLVWEDPDGLVLPSETTDEPRWMALGTVHGIVLAVVFTYREPATIRLISARCASRKERARYAHR